MKIDTKFGIGEKVYFKRVVSSKTERCSTCRGSGRFEDDTHYGGISYVGCSKCDGKGTWIVDIPPETSNAGPFEILKIQITKDKVLYFLDQDVLRDWKYDPIWFNESKLYKRKKNFK